MGVIEDAASGSGAAGSDVPGNPALVLLQELLEMLGSREPNGGLVSVVEGFRQAGLSDVMSSWIGTGWGLTISPQELQQGLAPSACSTWLTRLACRQLQSPAPSRDGCRRSLPL